MYAGLSTAGAGNYDDSYSAVECREMDKSAALLNADKLLLVRN